MRINNVSLFYILLAFIFLNACASTGTPGGGPKDVTPPKILKSIPLENQANYNKKRVEIFFDEIVSLENPSEKVIVSPPQKNAPIAKAIGSKILVLLSDSLLPATTYSIDFTDAIVDYNEKNKFGDYAFSFSTGGKIDSLKISGAIIDASNLNPVSDVIVGVYSTLNDSCFTKIPFERISKSNKDGFFSVKGLSERPFNIYALGDKNRDFRFDQPGEAIAFSDSSFKPWTVPCQRNDTIWKDTITVDTIIVRDITCYKPDDVILYYFSEEFGRQYLAKRERATRSKLGLVFGYKSETLPKLTLLNNPSTNWYLLEKNPTNDTLAYWITDTIVSSMDTLQIQIDYFKTDSLNKLSPAMDTLSLISRSPRAKIKPDTKKKKDKDSIAAPIAAPKVYPLELKSDLQGTMEIFSAPRIQWDTPIKEIKGDPWSLFKKKDTLWIKTPFKILKDSSYLRDYTLQAKWEFGEEYRFDIDSGAVVGIYGRVNNKYTQTFKIREEEEYSRLTITLSGVQGAAFVELLNKTDNVLRRCKVEKSIADFKYLLPGAYYIRAIGDRNSNFKWDTGSYAEKRQPESVWYNPKEFKLRVNCDYNELWDVLEYPILEQKPKALKPKDSKKER